MQQSLFFLLVFLTLSACNSASENETETTPVAEEEDSNLILGKWNMDSSVFINGGVRGTVSAPLIQTSWKFTEDGDYTVQNSVTMPGTFTNTTDSLFVVLMGVPNEYEILLLNTEKLQLRSTITETAEVSMKTDAFLTRIAE